MGVGTVTEARETTRGEVRDGGRTLAPQETTFDPTRAKVDPFKARQIQIESLRPVAEAMRRHELATKGIETASATKADIDEIRNGNPDGDGNGNYKGMWRDRNGVWNLPLNSDRLTAEGREEMTRRAMEEIRHRRDRRLAGETNDVRAFVNRETGEDIAAFEGDCEEALLVGRIGENFARAQASVAGDAGAMTSTALGRIGSDNAQLKTLKVVGGDEFDAGAAARERTDLWARQYVRKSLEGRMKAAVVLASQSGGLMSPAAAMRRANEIYDGQASELLRRLVEAGEYDRARTFVGHAEELGYSGAVKAKALADIDRAEDAANKRAFNGMQATAQSAVAMGRLTSDPETGEVGMEDALKAIRSAKEKFAVGTELRAAYDRLEAQVGAEADKEAARSLENAVLSDGSYDPEGAREKRLYPAVRSKVEEMRRRDRERTANENDESIMFDELMLDYAIQSGTLSDGEIGRRMRDIHERATALARGRLLKPEDYAAFGKRWKARNAADESAAGVMFDRAFGLSLKNFVDARGDISTEITDKSYKDTLRSGQNATFPGTDEKISLGEYLKWRAAFLGQLRELPQDASRKQHAKELLGRFKAGWYARQTDANIEALSRTMVEIRNGIEAVYEAERMRAAAEAERRNMPIVDRRHPANAEPQPDPLEFYRQANPLDPTLKFR